MKNLLSMKCYLPRLFIIVNNYSALLRPIHILSTILLAPVIADRYLSPARIWLDNHDE